jgi:hypothetical protein
MEAQRIAVVGTQEEKTPLVDLPGPAMMAAAGVVRSAFSGSRSASAGKTKLGSHLPKRVFGLGFEGAVLHIPNRLRSRLGQFRETSGNGFILTSSMPRRASIAEAWSSIFGSGL